MATQQPSQEGPSQPIDIGESQIFEYEELQEATKFFNPSQRVGEGAFGLVYRGDLTDGRAVAIKELILRNKKSIGQFFNEACLLSRLRHDNLVTLYGCTNPIEEKMLLVYEFAHNGAVLQHIHHRRFLKKALTWSQRLQIATQTADALAHLHSLQPAIIHRDIKTDNILLDKNFNAKVADFGLCRLLPPTGAHVSTMAQGTQGYLAPECIQFGKLTTKSDVYSFGVVLLELISSKDVLDYEGRDGDEVWLVSLAFNKRKTDRLEELVDLELGYPEDPKIFKMINSVVQLASKCLESIEHRRPLMVEVLESLKEISGYERPLDLSQSPMFDYDKLQEATKFFNRSEVIGKGSFGVVYRGKLGDEAVAIRELIVHDKRRIEKFFSVLGLLSRLRNSNLVRLYGRTDLQGDKMLVVYEFVPNGTLADRLRDKRFSEERFENKKLKIAMQIARGIAYLHTLEPPVIHGDIKTRNILLDTNFRAKVADFGTCHWQSISTMPLGTQGYPDPDYNLTTKSDVYNFGVLLMELLSRKVAADGKRGGDKTGKRNHPLEPPADIKFVNADDFILHPDFLAYACMNQTESMRPTMMEVLASLTLMYEHWIS